MGRGIDNMKNYSAKAAFTDLALTLGIMVASAWTCLIVQYFTDEDTYAMPVFILGVVFAARFTNGYVWGFLASLISTLMVNWAFTEPYYELDASIVRYPITFVISLCAAFVISMLTTRIRRQSEIKGIAEREKLRADLLRSVSHDIRTPLTSIAGAASVYLDNRDILPEEKKIKLIEDVRDESEWLMKVIENILTITRVDSSGTAVSKRPEAAEEVIGEVVMNFRPAHPEITVNADVPSELLMVPMDALLVEQVMKNILENSVVHGKNVTEINIKLSSDDKYALFAFEDNGGGFPEDVLEHIFDGMIYKPAEKVVDGRRCMGIGLSLCRSVIKLHGGELRALNGKDGARLEFTLPLDEKMEVK